MSDDLDKLSRLTPPDPRPEARKAALNAAMMVFDANATQGSDKPARLKGVTNIFRSVLMHLTKPSSNWGPGLAVALTVTVALPVALFVTRQGDAPTELQTAPVVAPLVVEEAVPAPAQTLGRADLQSLSDDEAPEARLWPRPETRRVAPAPEIIDQMPQGIAPGEQFAEAGLSGFQTVVQQPVSTFSADVDTASYARMRRAILAGQVPPPQMIRTEEVVNAFDYDYPAPEDREVPFRATTTLTDSPWTEGAQLLHIGVQGYDLPPDDRPQANLVFLIDASGSMAAADKLPLLKRSLEMLLGQLAPEDTVAIVVYAGDAGVVLEPTPAAQADTIGAALTRIGSGGGTAGAAGIEAAYALAERAFVEGGANRVILATDGDFNVGASDPDALQRLIEEKRDSGVFLSVLGFGTGNLRDDTMQALAQAGNGTAAYIDNLREARRVLVEQVEGSLFTIAKDVKFQVEFNPTVVEQYRLIGYETRALSREDFNDDRVDAGEIGAGHSVTAIYEVLPHGVRPAADPLRYGAAEVPPARVDTSGRANEVAFLQMRWKAPDGVESEVVSLPVEAGGAVPFRGAPAHVRFGIAAAAFAEKLRGADGPDDLAWAEIAQLARGAIGDDPDGRRRELVELVELMAAMAP